MLVVINNRNQQERNTKNTNTKRKANDM